MDHPTHGCVLLLDGTPDRRRGALPNPTAHAIAGASPRGFLAAASADVVQLPAMAGPQSVLAYLQDAARVPGPLLVWVTGHVMVPARRSTELHLALRESTASTVRYTGLPWEWLTRTLREHAGPTLLLVDAEADAHAWPHVSAAAHDGSLAAGLAVCGVLTPAAAKPSPEAGPYTRAFLTALSVGHPAAGPTLDPVLPHQLALTQATLPEGFLALQYGATGPVLANRAAPGPAAGPPAVTAPPAAAPEPPQPEEDPLPRILAAARAGRHNEAAAMAAAWEQQTLRRHGPHSAEAGLWVEVRADLARLAGDHPRAAELWMSAASHRLARGGPADTEALAALKRAHYCWQHSGDRARRLAPALLALWEQLPDGSEAAADVRTRLEETPPTLSR
ncbi:hypothetical protein BLA24_11985 [Streptomyces cinnamoneus]|uniref:Uncharacterized protein n=1 Tax=Streptomyces cinnamoneus TaxID=53446 RepID=A0A2G1XKN4_STRCJ|nr:hypothetical protein [Streptomyces cinnamoneus]PHQ51795.1 hypothetical protein BLA24_11985 [Streptomyces cinnamoneus]PPT12041.1 hypothetical protein CYQ11_03225 [Streptomyces cinnamoneus]